MIVLEVHLAGGTSYGSYMLLETHLVGDTSFLLKVHK